MPAASKDSFAAKDTLTVGENSYDIFKIVGVQGLENADRLPFSLKVLLENLIRTEDGANITAEHIQALADWDPSADPNVEIQFTPARVIMQDFTGVPCVVDLATMREAMADLGGDPDKINPLAPAEMVIDHSVIADVFGRADAFERNVDLEYERNRERYQFLRWGQTAFDEFKVVPPGTGIVHQVNIEHLARVVMYRGGIAYPDSCVGTDSHTTMVNGIGVLGWGVGGIEAEAAMLGQPVSMLIPRVVGFKLTGEIPPGTTATDVVLTITEKLRKHGVVGKFVEFYGAGVGAVPLANRATIGNMSPEFGSTAAMFPIDEETTKYLRLTGRPEEQVALVEAYAKAQGLWHDADKEPVYSEYLELDLSTVVPSIAGPKRPQDRIELSDAKGSFRKAIHDYVDLSADTPHTNVDEASEESFPASDPPSISYVDEDADVDVVAALESAAEGSSGRPSKPTPVSTTEYGDFVLDHGAVVIAAITSCTNTSNPSVMLGAALLARNAVNRGLTVKPWVKTTMAPGSQVVTDYYEKAGLWPYLEKLGLRPGRLRLHHLYRQLRPVAGGDLRGGQRGRPDGGLGAVRQPQLRGPDQPGREDELPGLSPAGDRLRAGRHDGLRLRDPAARPGHRRHRRLPEGHLAEPAGDPGDDGLLDQQGDVRLQLRRRVRRRRALEVAAHPGGQDLRVGPGVDLRPQAPVLRRHAGAAGPGDGHRRRPGAGQARRFGDHRPHLAGRRDQGRHPGRAVPDRAQHQPQGLQLLRLPPRQPRGDDPRHLRQHPAAQPAAR